MGILRKLHEEKMNYLFLGDEIYFSEVGTNFPASQGKIIGFYKTDELRQMLKDAGFQTSRLRPLQSSFEKIGLKDRNSGEYSIIYYDGSFHWDLLSERVRILKLGE